MKQWIIFIALSVFSLSTGWGQSFRAVVSKAQVQEGETFQVFFELENMPEGELSYPSLEDFRILGGPNRSQQVRIVNNQVSQSVSWSFHLQPKKKGTFTIGPAAYKTASKTFRSEPIKIAVRAGGAPATNSSGNANARQPDIASQLKDLVFIKAFLSKGKVYQGEQVSVTYKLYVKRGVRITDIIPAAAPKYNGFWVEEIDTGNAQLRPDEYNGEAFDAAVVKKVILFPQKSGRLSIDPFELESVVQVRAQNQRPQSIFDSFFERFQNVPYKFSSNPIELEVVPLPSHNRPADFSGVVGTFDLAVKLDSTNIETGQSLTLQVELNGKGNIQSIREPRLDFPPDFDVYDAQVDDKTSRKSGIVSGSKSFDYLIIPRNPGEFKLPPVNFSYFDINRGDYVTLQGPSLTLRVSGEPQTGSATQATGLANKEDLALMNQEIRYISVQPGQLKPVDQRFAGSGFHFLLYLLPFLAFGFLVYYKRKREANNADVAGTRMRKANKIATKRLKAADKLRQAGNEKGFYDEVIRAFWGYLGDKLTLTPSELSRDNISEALRNKQVKEPLIEQVTIILDTCEMALFSPMAKPNWMDNTYQQALSLIVDMEKELS